MEDTLAGICADAYIYTIHNARMHAHVHRRSGGKLRLEAPKHRLTVTLLPAPVGGAQGTSPACPLLLLIQRVPPAFKPGLRSNSYSHHGGKAQPSKNSSLIYIFLSHFSSKAKILGLELPAQLWAFPAAQVSSMTISLHFIVGRGAVVLQSYEK